MDPGYLILVAAAVALGLAQRFMFYARERETDRHGNLILRYLAAPPIIAACGIFFLAVAIVQWRDPENHLYSGNVALLSLTPGVVGICSIAFAGYMACYRVTLTVGFIEVRRWPLASFSIPLSQLSSIDATSNRIALLLPAGRRHVFYKALSGHAAFVKELSLRLAVLRRSKYSDA